MIKQVILMIVILSSSVLAYNPSEPLTELGYGENTTLKLQPFTRHYLKIYEGSSVQFSTYTREGNIKAYNSIIIKEIGEKETAALLSIKGKKYEEIRLKLGKNYKVEFNGSIPFMFIKEDTLHYEINPKERYIILYFNVPQFQIERETATGRAVINFDDIEGVKKEETISLSKAIILLLGITAIAGTFVLFKRSKQH